MKRISTWIGVVLLGKQAIIAATTPLYQNTTISTNPQVDAISFENSGTLFTYDPNYFSGGTFNPIFNPFRTLNTSFYTNRPGATLDGATLSGAVGFDFRLATNGGLFPAQNFVNLGSISAASHVLVNANNITNRNSVFVSSGGLIRFQGKSVDLSHGSAAIGGSRSVPILRGIAASRYTNPLGVYDLYWGTGINDLNGNTDEAEGSTLPLNQISTLPPFSPPHWVIDPAFGTSNLVSLPQFHNNYIAYVRTNSGGGNGSRPIIQVVFVPADIDPLLTTTVRFYQPGLTRASEPIVEFAMKDTDVTTLQPTTNYVYLLDRTPLVTTNNDFSTNLIFGTYQTYRPNVYEITRSTPFEWITAVGTNGSLNLNGTNILFNPGLNGGYTSNRPVAFYSGYAAQIGKITSFAGTPAHQPTNSDGRIEITGDNLSIAGARMRADNLISIISSNLISTSNSFFDAPFLNYNVSTTNSSMVLNSLITNTVRRLTGQVYAWSAYWTNQIRGTNIFPQFSVLIVDHNLTTTSPVLTGTLNVKATNLVISDSFFPQVALSLDARNLTMNGTLDLSSIGNAGVRNFPNLSCFTNTGLITSPYAIQLGSDTALPLAKVINSGTISANSLQIRSLLVDGNGGSLSAGSGSFILDGQTTRLTNNAFVASGSDFQLNANDLTAAGSIISPGGLLRLSVTNSVNDGSGGTTNVWTSPTGFELLRKPTTGDLLNTRVLLTPPLFGFTTTTWTGADRGRTVAGYSNNCALRHLVLDGGFGSFFSFSGVGGTNALYVDYLEFQNEATNYLTSLDISSDLIIYFADSNLPVDKLDKSHNDHLRWVKSYAGPLSGTNITLPPRVGEVVGQTVSVNRALLLSGFLDSDADGTLNKDEVANMTSPFDGVTMYSQVTNNNIILRWLGAAETIYRVECSTNLMGTNGTWMSLAYVTNAAPTNMLVSFSDALSHSNCVYRVSYNPSGQFP